MLPPTYEVDTELRHILAVCIMCPCDLYARTGSRDRNHLLGVPVQFEVYRPSCFLNTWP